MRSILTIFCALLLGCNAPDENEIIVATASNMRFAMEKITDQFSSNTGLKCKMVVSSSGKLTAQIKEGAPYDVLVSADMKYPSELMRAGLTADAPKVYALGKLVLWSQVENYKPTIEDLTLDRVKHIAIANPETAPYGVAAMEVLQRYGIIDTVQKKLVFGESISQVNQFVASGSATVGFTAKSVVLSDQLKDTGTWIDLDKNSYVPIKQGVVVIPNGNQELGMQFVEFLFSSNGQEILQKYGYEVGDEL